MAGSGTAHLRRDDPDVILTVENMVVEFPAGKGQVVHAVSDVSFDVRDGETLGLVGESGCGKSTTAKAVVQLVPPTSGRIDFSGTDLAQLKGEALRRMRPEIQMIFQDPISSLNPRRKVFDIVSEGVSIWGGADEGGGFSLDRVAEIIEAVGLDAETAKERRPHEYSGGQCQRISVA
ncbi:MAG: ATP-binding cassette domain-containing protein, partial [Actinomycetota bacterium]